MELRKIYRGRQKVITFTDAKGIRRETEVLRDNLRSKKPPVWIQELMKDLQELEKGA